MMEFKRYTLLNPALLFIYFVSIKMVKSQNKEKENNFKLDFRNKLDEILIDKLIGEDGDHYLYQPYITDTGVGNRDELRLLSVDNVEFVHGHGVYKWYSLRRSDKIYLLGLAESKLVAVTGSHNLTNVITVTEQVPATPLVGSLLSWWNATNKRTDIISVVALSTPAADIVWYRYNGTILEKFLSWQYHKAVSHMKVVSVSEQLFKLILLNSNDNSMDIYDISIRGTVENFNENIYFRNDPYFALSQSIPLRGSSESFATSIVGGSMYLFVTQNDLNSIFLFGMRLPLNYETTSHFSFLKNFTFIGVKELTTFVTAHQNFLLVTGDNPGILKITSKGELINNLNTQLGPVDKWLPINVHTYRDDVLILAYERKSKPVKFLTWFGTKKQFGLLPKTPCNYDDVRKDDNAELCNLDYLYGKSTEFLLGPTHLSSPTLLIPFTNGTSKIYFFRTSLQEVGNPLLWELQKLLERKSFIEELWKGQKEGITKAEERLKFVVKRNESNIITGRWTVEKLFAPRLSIGENASSKYSNNSRDIKPSFSNNTRVNIINKMLQINETVKFIKSELDNNYDYGYMLQTFGKVKGRVVVNGKTFIKNAEITGDLNGMSVNKLLHDTFRLDRSKKITGTKTINSLKTNRIVFKNLNNITDKNLLFKDHPIVIKNNLTIQSDLKISGDVILPPRGKINGIDLSNEVLVFGVKYPGHLNFTELDATDVKVKDLNGLTPFSVNKPNQKLKDKVNKNLVARHNLTVNKLNGVNWSELVHLAVWLNKDTEITGTVTVKGKIFTKSDLFYNTAYFPVYNEKMELKTSRSSGNLKDNIYNNFTNSDDDSDSIFAVDENKEEEFPNVTTKHTRCNKDLQFASKQHEQRVLKGDVIINNMALINGTLSSIKKNNGKWVNELKDIVKKSDSQPVIINGEKTFTSGIVINSSLVMSGLINGVNISNLITTDTNQTINGNITFNKLVEFNDIILNGTFDGENITNINNRLLNFVHKRSIPRLSLTSGKSAITSDCFIPTIEVIDNNRSDISPMEDGYIQGDLNDNKVICIEDINAIDLEVSGNITVEGWFGDINLTHYQKLLSLNERNSHESDVHLKEANISKLTVEHINDYSLDEIHKLNCEQILMGENLKGIKFSEIVVDGNISTENGVNGYNITEMNKWAIGLERNNFVEGELVFEDTIECENLDVKGYINDEINDFTALSKDIVKKTDKNVVITATKVFEDSLIINGDLHLQSINNMNVPDILTKQGDQTIKGKLDIEGKVKIIGDLHINGLINEANLSIITSKHKYLNGVHYWNGDVIFKRPVNINHLFVDGFVNKMNFTNFILNMYLDGADDQIRFTDPKTFKKNVTMLDNLRIENNFNEVNLNKFLEDVMYVDKQLDATEKVTFSNKVIIGNDLNVDYDVSVSSIYGCNLIKLVKEAVYIDRPDYISGSVTFKNAVCYGEITTAFINGLDMNKLFYLNKDQTIISSLKFNKITVLNDLSIGFLVNGVRLDDEFQNTLLTEGDQVIKSKLFIDGNIFIKGNLVTEQSVNGKLLENVATLHGNNSFSDQLIFDCVNLQKNLKIQSNVISGIDIPYWDRQAILKDTNQNVLGVWDIKGNVSFHTLTGAGHLNDVNVFNLDNKFDIWKGEQINLQYKIKKNYSEQCHKLEMMTKKARTQLYELQSFERFQNFSFENNEVGNIHLIKIQEENCLAVTMNRSCELIVYKWNNTKVSFENYFEQKFINVKNMLSFNYGNETFLVTNMATQYNFNCFNVSGNLLWIYSSEGLKFQLVENLNSTDELIKRNDFDNKNHNDGVFYSQSNNCVHKWTVFKDIQGNYRTNRTHCIQSETDLSSVRELIRKLRKEEYSSLINISDNDTVITEYTTHPKLKFVAVAVVDYPKIKSRTDFVKIYDKSEVALLNKISTLKPALLNWFDIAGQNWISFIENGTTLQVYEAKNENSGYVNRLSTFIPTRQLLTISLPIRHKLNPIPIMILLGNNNVIHFIKGNMVGDPYNGPSPNCDTSKGIN